MKSVIAPSYMGGCLTAPSSKSHTIRAYVAALLAEGSSKIEAPLRARDTDSAMAICRLFGAEITLHDGGCIVKGVGGEIRSPPAPVDVGNSGTTLRICAAVAALSSAPCRFDGDAQVRSRPMRPLLAALVELGAEVRYVARNGYAPFTIRGPLRGGSISIDSPTSQYLSALLFATPAASGKSAITVTKLEERPYIDMTLQWLDRCGIRYQKRDALHYDIPGGQRYRPFVYRVEGDYSSATFFICAAALVGRGVRIDNVWRDSAQGDRRIVAILRQMGVAIVQSAHSIYLPPPSSTARMRRGGAFDLSSMPDALPALMACACFAPAPVIIRNVAHARIKETDRIACMTRELRKMGARITEYPDGVRLLPSASFMHGARVDGHGDHRIVMALAITALAVRRGVSVITDAEAAAITYPNFFSEIEKLIGKKVKVIP